MSYWTAKQILQQATGELGLPQTPASVDSPGSIQGWALLNAAGNDLVQLYPWGQLLKEWDFTTTVDEGEYAVPDDWSYFIDQTQWDRTDHWPLLGPKSPQEWAWLKGGLLTAAPRMRYRVMDNKFMVWPIPGAAFNLAMEYIVKNWVITNDGIGEVPTDMATKEGDIVQLNPWLVVKYVKLKFYELKGFNQDSSRADFMRMFLSLTGKDKGAPKLSLAPIYPPLFIGPWSIPDGSWDTSGKTP